MHTLARGIVGRCSTLLVGAFRDYLMELDDIVTTIKGIEDLPETFAEEHK